MTDMQQQLTESQSGNVGFCPATLASCNAASLLLCLLQHMTDVQQQLTESLSGNAQLQAEEAELQQRLASQQSDLASVSSRLEEEQRFRNDAQTQLQTVSWCFTSLSAAWSLCDESAAHDSCMVSAWRLFDDCVVLTSVSLRFATAVSTNSDTALYRLTFS